MAAKAYIFDLDGTLTDPRRGIVRCLLEALGEVGVPPPAGDLTRFIGPPLADTFTLLAGDASLGAVALAAFRRRYAEDGLFENEVYPGIEALLTAASRDAALYVATSKPRVFAERILERFGLARHFTAVHGAELSGERADKAELLRHLCAQEGISPSTAIMIGDREQDIAAARANGMRSVGVTWGFGSQEELAGSDAICLSPYDLAALLRTL